MNETEYLNSLDIHHLLDLLDARIRHSHYCPAECHCFDGFLYGHYSIEEIKEQIIRMANEKPKMNSDYDNMAFSHAEHLNSKEKNKDKKHLKLALSTVKVKKAIKLNEPIRCSV